MSELICSTNRHSILNAHVANSVIDKARQYADAEGESTLLIDVETMSERFEKDGSDEDVALKLLLDKAETAGIEYIHMY
jgi:hypothetical protein